MSTRSSSLAETEALLADAAPQLMRRSFPLFVPLAFQILHREARYLHGWHIEAMAHHLANPLLRRLIITIPPRYLKSITGSVAFPAWLLGRDPTAKIIVVSYGQDLASKHGRDFRRLVESPEYRRLFPHCRFTRLTETEVLTSAGGSRRSVSLGGALTGHGATHIILDDPMKANDAASAVERARVIDFYRSTLVSRLDDKGEGRIIVIAQRLHQEDLPGHLMETGTFHHLNLPAIAPCDAMIPLAPGRVHHWRTGEALCPEREPLEALDDLRRQMTDAVFSAQYLQEPVVTGGQLIRWSDVHFSDTLLTRDDVHFCVQSWDTAYSDQPGADFSVCTTWGFRDNRWHLLDVERTRLLYPDLQGRVLCLQTRWQADLVLIENAGSGRSLLQTFRAGGHVRFIPTSSTDSKEVRVAAQTARIREGLIVLPRSAPWLEDLRRECVAFPNGTHDDQVDSLTQFVRWAGSHRARGYVECWQNNGRPQGRPRPISGREALRPLRPRR